jgi:hypothetical protein
LGHATVTASDHLAWYAQPCPAGVLLIPPSDPVPHSPCAGWNACSSCYTDNSKQRKYLILPGVASGRIYGGSSSCAEQGGRRGSWQQLRCCTLGILWFALHMHAFVNQLFSTFPSKAHRQAQPPSLKAAAQHAPRIPAAPPRLGALHGLTITCLLHGVFTCHLSTWWHSVTPTAVDVSEPRKPK